MLSDEERKAIERVEQFIDGERQYNTKTGEAIIPYEYGESQRFVFKETYYAIQVVLNLIEKQSKIISKLYKSLEDDIGNIINLGILLDENAREKRDVSKYIDEVQLFLNTLNYNYISKDKIKSKIEEYDKLQKEMTFKNHNADNINDCYKYGDKAQKAMYQKEVLQSLLEDNIEEIEEIEEYESEVKQ